MWSVYVLYLPLDFESALFKMFYCYILLIAKKFRSVDKTVLWVTHTEHMRMVQMTGAKEFFLLNRKIEKEVFLVVKADLNWTFTSYVLYYLKQLTASHLRNDLSWVNRDNDRSKMKKVTWKFVVWAKSLRWMGRNTNDLWLRVKHWIGQDFDRKMKIIWCSAILRFIVGSAKNYAIRMW